MSHAHVAAGVRRVWHVCGGEGWGGFGMCTCVGRGGGVTWHSVIVMQSWKCSTQRVHAHASDAIHVREALFTLITLLIRLQVMRPVTHSCNIVNTYMSTQLGSNSVK